MNIRILAVGSIKESFYKDAISEFKKRLTRYTSLEIVEVKDEKTARKQALLNAQAEASETASANVTSSDLLRMMNTADNSKVFNVIIKGDVLGSVTSVVDSLKMIDTKGEISLNIVSSGVGDVTENDVYMAEGDNTVIYGFNVNIPTNIVNSQWSNCLMMR